MASERAIIDYVSVRRARRRRRGVMLAMVWAASVLLCWSINFIDVHRDSRVDVDLGIAPMEMTLKGQVEWAAIGGFVVGSALTPVWMLAGWCGVQAWRWHRGRRKERQG